MTPTGGSHGKSHRTTKILSHASRRRGGRVAGGDVGAAAGEATDHRVLGLGYAYGPWPLGRCFFAAAARTRLDRRSQPRHRVSLGGGKPRSRRRVRVRVRPTQSRYYCHICSPNGSRGKAGDIDHPDRLRGGSGPGRYRSRRLSGAAGRQRYRTVRPAHRDGKRLALLREIVASLRRLAVMANVDNPASDRELGEVQAVAGTLGLEIATLEIRRAGDIVPAFESLKDHADALYV